MKHSDFRRGRSTGQGGSRVRSQNDPGEGESSEKGGDCEAAEAGKTATTSDTTAVLLADFYRQGDGINESFTAKMFVSKSDLAPDIAGVQNVWIQGIGCGSAITNFN